MVSTPTKDELLQKYQTIATQAGDKYFKLQTYESAALKLRQELADLTKARTAIEVALNAIVKEDANVGSAPMAPAPAN